MSMQGHRGRVAVVPMLRTQLTGARSSIIDLLRVRSAYRHLRAATPYSTWRSGKNFFIDVESGDPALLAHIARELRAEVGRFFPEVGAAWLPQLLPSTDRTEDREHLSTTTLLAAANVSVRRWPGAEPTLAVSALETLRRFVTSRPEPADVARVLNVVACAHGRASFGSQPLERLPLAIAVRRTADWHLAMTDVFSYGMGFQGPDLRLQGQLAPIQEVATSLTEAIVSATELSRLDQADQLLLAALDRVAAVRHEQQRQLREYLDEIHLGIAAQGGLSFETHGDGVIALLPDEESLTRLRTACAVQHSVGISGVGAVRLGRQAQGLRELTTRLEFMTGVAKMALAESSTRETVPVVYGHHWPTELRDAFWQSVDGAPEKNQRWLYDWLAARPQDHHATLGASSGQVVGNATKASTRLTRVMNPLPLERQNVRSPSAPGSWPLQHPH